MARNTKANHEYVPYSFHQQTRARARSVFCFFLFFPFFILFSKRSESECADFQWQTASHSNLIRHKVQLDGCVAVASGSCLFSHHSKWINLKNKHILMSSLLISLSLSPSGSTTRTTNRNGKRKRRNYNQISVWHIYCARDNDTFRNSSVAFVARTQCTLAACIRDYTSTG